jgi:methylglutaconyl-CoA hydratase
MKNPVETQITDRIAKVSINRPDVRNALNQETIRALSDAFKKISTSPDARVVLFTGNGTEAFCAGADLNELRDAKTKEQREQFFSGLSQLIQTMHAVPQPIIALVHGYALAGGCGLAAAADIVIAAESAVFGLPELRIGLVPMVVMPVLHRAIGRRALSELVLGAERINAQRALEIGLVSHVVANDKLLDTGIALAQKIAVLAPGALHVAKKMLYDVGERSYTECLSTYPEKIAALSSTEEAMEGIAAFIEKRDPRWK